MRGSPLLRAFLIIAVLLLGMIPLWKLTHAADAVMAAAPAPVANLHVHVELTFSHPVTGFQILYLGKVIMEGEATAETAQKDVDLHFPKAGVDLQVKAACSDPAANTAVRVTVTPDNQDAIERTAWGQKGSIDEVLTFQESN